MINNAFIISLNTYVVIYVVHLFVNHMACNSVQLVMVPLIPSVW